MMNITGKTVFLAGAGSDLGSGIALALAGHGARLMLCDSNRPPLDETRARITEQGGEVECHVADIVSKEGLRAAAAATITHFGKVHMLVHIAGIGDGSDYGEWTDASWKWTIDTNLMSVVWGIEIFGPLIERHGDGGHILASASMAGLIRGGSPAYRATQFAVVGLMEGLRPSLALRDIGVTLLLPGFVRTQARDAAPDLWHGERDGVAVMPERNPVTVFPAKTDKPMPELSDPMLVGQLVVEGIENDWPHIPTETDFEPELARHLATLSAAFERVRDRVPK